MKWLYLIACLPLIASCSILAPRPYYQINYYQLNQLPPKKNYSVKKSKKRGVLLIALPSINPELNTTQMAYSQKPYQINYFSKNKWIAPPNQMVQAAMVAALNQAGYYQAVIPAPSSSKIHYLLTSQITSLTQDFTHKQAFFKLSINVQLINSNQAKIIAKKTFTIVQPMLEITPYAGVLAANQVMANFLNQLNQFCLTYA